MSHFTEMQVAFTQDNEQSLIEALEKQFGKGSVEIHEEGAALFGYQGDNRAKKPTTSADYAPPCHVIVRRKNVGSASNDVGYRRTEDGKYVAYISEYDQSHNFTKKKQGLVSQEYTLHVAERKLKKQGYMVKRVPAPNGAYQVVGTKV